MLFNIFLKYRGYTNIDDSEYLQCYGAQNNQPMAWDLRVRSFDPNDTHYDYSCINVFVTGIGSGAIHEYSDVFLKYTVLNGSINNITSIIHEFGHALGLLHIFEGTMGTVDFVYDNLPDCIAENPPASRKMAKPNFNGYTPQPFFPSGPENVTRDPNDANYNADVAGDFVVDTNASFRGLNSNCCSLGNEQFTFQTNPAVVDQTGEMYVDLDDERTNYMHYASEINHFSNGQGVRMRESIENDINGHLQEKLTPIASLYEPYRVEMIGTISDEIHSLTDNGNGTAEVCRLKNFTLNHYFQPGFDYWFYQGNTTNETHHANRTDFYGILDEGILRYVKIGQINPSFLTNEFDSYITSYSDIQNGVIFYEATPCLLPEIICITEPYDGGKITTTTNLANPNVTIKVLNNQEASDPNLEQSLENNKYHIIEKTTTSGAIIQKTIYKSGNN